MFLLAAISMSVSLSAGDTVRYTLQQCREMALSNSASARAQESSVLAAKYNRQAALAAVLLLFTVTARLRLIGIAPRR